MGCAPAGTPFYAEKGCKDLGNDRGKSGETIRPPLREGAFGGF